MKYSSILLYSFLFILALPTQAQENTVMLDKLPFYEIPEAPEEFTVGTITSRMVQGLGFRYYWATIDLREEDLEYKASETGRTVFETMEHICGLSQFFLNAVTSTPNGNDKTKKTYESLRKETLLNFERAAQLLQEADKPTMAQMKIIFERREKTSEYPFWNALNGPLEDAVWHVGQIVMLRRASGNPWNSKASVFTGKVRS